MTTIRDLYEWAIEDSRSSFWIIEIPDLDIPSVYNRYSTKVIYFLKTFDEVKRFSVDLLQ